MSQMQPKGSTIGLLKDGKTVQEKFDNILDDISDLNDKKIKEEVSVIYAINHGVVADDKVDSSDAIQALIDSVNSIPIVLPSPVGIKKSIKYRTRTCIKGREGSFSQITMMSGFVGGAAFEPFSTNMTGTDSAVLEGLTITDASAINDGRGTTSTKNGIDITGSYNILIKQCSGVRVNYTITSSIGTEVQHTRRARIDSLHGSNVNRHIYLPGSGGGRFAYGDIYISDMKTAGACKLPNVIETTDGLQIIGGVIFPGGGFRVSGHYIDIIGVHMFEPKAPLGSGEIPAGIHITKRNNTEYSRHVNISGVALAFPGRLADTTSGNPPQTNEPAPGILMERVEDFNISVTVNHSGMQSARLSACRTGILNLASEEANTQLLGSGALPPGTYDTLLMEACGEVVVHIADNSSSRRYAVNLDDACVGCMITGSVARGQTLGTDFKYPNNPYNRLILSVEGSNSERYQYDSTPPVDIYVNAPSGDTSPSVTGGVNKRVVAFSNSSVVQVTDLPDVGNRREVTIWLNDNNATRIMDVSNGGKFKTLSGSNLVGRGTYARFVRDAATGNLIQF